MSARDLTSVVPLPFRRVISAEQSKKLWNELKIVWDIRGGYWFLLRKNPTPPNVLAFHVDYYKAINGFALIHDARSRCGISRVFELHEFGPGEPDYEIELSTFAPAFRWGG